ERDSQQETRIGIVGLQQSGLLERCYRRIDITQLFQSGAEIAVCFIESRVERDGFAEGFHRQLQVSLSRESEAERIVSVCVRGLEGQGDLELRDRAVGLLLLQECQPLIV